MPHKRPRYLQTLISPSLAHSPIIGILGQRQTGKTTMVQEIAKEYETLDRRASLDMAESAPEEFIKNRKIPFAIDECQMAPPLFPALKEAVRIFPKKGQFILTGSVRFTSRKAIRESLTGRIFNLQLLPLSISENYEEPLPTKLISLQTKNLEQFISPTASKVLAKATTRFENFLQSGGLPGICFYRDPAIRSTYFDSHLETLLDRDLRLVHATALPFATLRAVLAQLAQKQGLPIEYTEFARGAQISVITLKKLLSSFEAIFLIRRVASTGDSTTPVFFLEDQGLATHLLKSIGTQTTPQQDLLRGLYSNLLPQFHYRPELSHQVFQYRTRGGAWVPLAFKTIHGHLGVIPCLEEHPTPTSIGSARSFLKHFTKSKVVIACTGKVTRVWDERLISLPFTAIF